jgi:RNA recognition motif-containing protein
MSVEAAPIGNYPYHNISDYKNLCINNVHNIPPGRKSAGNVPVKLFVGRFPLTMLDHELKTYFDPFGMVLECIILRDMATKASKGYPIAISYTKTCSFAGCAFVRYEDVAAAVKCIRELNNKKILDPTIGTLQVVY